MAVLVLAALAGSASLLGQGAAVPVVTTTVGAVEIVPVRERIFMLAGPGGNVTVQAGPQAVVVVDTMTAAATSDLLDAIEAIAPGIPIRYVLNTSADADHAGGNAAIAAAGSQLIGGNFFGQLGTVGTQSAFIFAHENVLKALVAPRDGGAPAAFAALPTDTFFQARKDLFVNGEAVQLLHQPLAHTDGDVFVFFRRSDVIATGDVFDMTAFPHIDLAAGGSVGGTIEALNTLVDLVVSEQYSEGGTQVVPGHGRIAEEMDVVQYRDMVTIVRDRVEARRAAGDTLETIVAARPAFEYEPRWGSTDGPWTTATFVEAVFRSLEGS